MKEYIGARSERLSLVVGAAKSSLGCPSWKRWLDVTLVSVGLIVVLPVMLLIALLIRLVSRGPIFFRQQRIGYSGKPFTVLKFRTMHVDADQKLHQDHIGKLIAQDLPLTKLDKTGDKRLIPFGAALRAACLDELPQLLNVLRGDMSLVGPRPCLDYEFSQLLPWHKQRFNTLPGMTGLWQVKRGAETSFREMMQMDLRYVANRSFWLDVSILAETGPAVLSQVRDSWAAKRRLRRQQS
jgi:exopolysaccharide production protein ExoY